MLNDSHLAEALLETAPDAQVLIDTSGSIVLVNAQFEKLFGYSRSEILGHKIETLMPHRFRNNHIQHRSQYIENPLFRPMGSDLELFGKNKKVTELLPDTHE